MLIVESLIDGKRMPTYARDKIVSLGEISMYTMGEDIALSEVLTNLGKKEELKAVSFDPKKADNNQLHAFFAEVLPDYDRDRVYPSDIRKLIQWYNILIGAGITDFTAEEEGETILMDEGCLSLPGIHEKVPRAEKVRIQYVDEDFVEHDEWVEGFLARVIQHEFDHLDGKVFTDRISPLRRQMNKAKFNALLSGKVRCDYKVKVAKK